RLFSTLFGCRTNPLPVQQVSGARDVSREGTVEAHVETFRASPESLPTHQSSGARSPRSSVGDSGDSRNASRGVSTRQTRVSPPLIYTEALRYEAGAATKGGERFPSGASLRIVEKDRPQPFVPGFAASADASVSFDTRRVLFAGKQKP